MKLGDLYEKEKKVFNLMDSPIILCPPEKRCLIEDLKNIFNYNTTEGDILHRFSQQIQKIVQLRRAVVQ